jgi:general secretion pathway protein D
VKSTINVGETFYVPNGQSQFAGSTTVSYSPVSVGVELDVTPRVTSSDTVSMDVNQTDNDLQSIGSDGEPITDTRTATTTVTVQDGRTVVLGGIISKTRRLIANKVPIIGDIPIIGNLFKSTSNEVQQTELLVLLTPHIIRTTADADKMTKEQTSDLSKQSQQALRQEMRN